MRYVIAYVAALVTFLLLDMMWLGWVAKDLYLSALGDLVLPQPNLLPAALCYVLYAVGIAIFAVTPGLDRRSAGRAAQFGALFGCFADATYDLTNLAALKGRPLRVALIDMAWGAVVSAVAASAGYVAAVRAARPSCAP